MADFLRELHPKKQKHENRYWRVLVVFKTNKVLRLLVVLLRTSAGERGKQKEPIKFIPKPAQEILDSLDRVLSVACARDKYYVIARLKEDECFLRMSQLGIRQ